MRRRHRILLELFAPVLLGAVGFYLRYRLLSAQALPGSPGGADVHSWPDYPLVLYLAYAVPFAGIPAAVCTLVMEGAFAAGLPPASWRTVGLAGLLGLASGLLLAAGIGDPVEQFLTVLGFLTGLFIGLTIRALSRQRAVA